MNKKPELGDVLRDIWPFNDALNKIGDGKSLSKEEEGLLERRMASMGYRKFQELKKRDEDLNGKTFTPEESRIYEYLKKRFPDG